MPQGFGILLLVSFGGGACLISRTSICEMAKRLLILAWKSVAPSNSLSYDSVSKSMNGLT